MGRNRKVVQQPMLYITQPELGPVKASMQSTYRTEKVKEEEKPAEVAAESKQQTSNVEKEPRHKKVNNLQKGTTNQEVKTTETNQAKQPSSKPQSRRQRFKEMNLVEKVNYFATLPNRVPKMKCEVLTEKNSFKGLILDYKDKIVYLQLFKRSKVIEIPLNDIKDIKLLGF